MKYRSIFAAAALLLAFAASVNAGRAEERVATAAETKLVHDCAAKHVDDDQGESQCMFKLVADPCTEKARDNVSNAECFRAETKIWDSLLNENYKGLADTLEDPKDQAKLKEMQRAWIQYRDTTCDFYWYKIHGTMSVPMTAACELRETARRALLLKFLQQL